MKLLKPDYYLNSVYDFNLEYLYEQGYKAILADLDNTLAPWDSDIVSSELKEWVNRILSMDMKIIIVSNARNNRVQQFVKELNISGIAMAKKPFGGGFKKALKKLGLTKDEVIMVGDQVFTDVLGARLQRIKVALVKPLSEKELMITKFMRYFEKSVRAEQNTPNLPQ